MTGSTTSLRRLDWLPKGDLIHLIWVANLLWQPFFNPEAGWPGWAVVAVASGLFVPLYLVAFHPNRGPRRAALFGTIVLGVLVTMVNVGGAVFFVYAGVMAIREQTRNSFRWLVGLSLAIAVLTVVSFVPMPYSLFGVLPSALFLWVIGLQTRVEVARETEAERLRIENVRIEQLATSAERERIARDLHDMLGQQLTGLVVRTQLLRSLIPTDPGEAVQHAAQVEDGVRDLLGQVRRTVGGLSEVSLADEVEAARRSLRAARVEAEFDLADPVPNPLIERSLALALRESVTNIIRHAGAGRCRITLRQDGHVWELCVSDDGVGGDVQEGNGLRGMRERVNAIGGRVERESAQGTTVVVTVPA